MKTKKIIFIVASLRKGGVERTVSLLTKEFASRGFSVKIIIFQNIIEYDYGGELIILDSKFSKNIFFKFFRMIFRSMLLKKIFTKENPDMIFSFMESANFPAILTGYDVFVSVRTNPDIAFPWYYKIIAKVLYKYKNVLKIICISKGIEKSLHNMLGVNNTVVIYNPIEKTTQAHTVEDLASLTPFIVAVGRLCYPKNFDMLVKAFSKTKARKYSKLVIIGEGSERKKITDCIHAYGLSDCVFLLGQKDAVFDYYRHAEMLVVSSRYEGLSTVILEALSAQCPVVSTDCDFGPRELLVDGYNGLLAENENDESLAVCIDRLYFDKELQKKIKNNSLPSIERFSIETITNQWIELGSPVK